MKFSMARLLNKNFNRRHNSQKKTNRTAVGAFKLLTLNVRGQGADLQTMRRRMKEWRLGAGKNQYDVIMVQDTHVSTQQQKVALQTLWLRGWGLTGVHCSTEYSWWSVGSSSSAGVGILVNPRTSLKIMGLVKGFGITTRRMAIATNFFTIVTVYAPTKGKSEREDFFQELYKKLTKHVNTKTMILVGDFNCCLTPLTDRQYLETRTAKTESVELTNLVTQLDLLDSVDLIETFPLNNNKNSDIINAELFTYHRSNAASRIDRFYMSVSLRSMFGRHKVWTSAIKTDHSCVELTLRDPKQIITGQSETKIYPTKIRNKKMQHACILKVLQYIDCKMTIWQNPLTVWETGKLLIAFVLHKLKQHDLKQQRWLLKLRKQRLKRQCQKGIGAYQADLARYVLVQEQSVEGAAKLMAKMNKDRLQAMTNQHISSRFFSRFRNGKDFKLISSIKGSSNGQNDSVAMNMAESWSTIFRTCHYSNRKAKVCMQTDFPEFAQYVTSVVNHDMNTDLVQIITEEDIILAIKKMKNNKTPGPDLIGNEFYKTYRTQLIWILQRVFNYALDKVDVPHSFQTARIYPQKKRGDSESGLDYRPIACLNGDYKLFTRILAERLKKVLNVTIEQSQHGGLPRRNLNGAIFKVQAAVSKMINNPNINLEDSSALLFLDIQKAYDSLEREFIYTVLRQCQFSDKFIRIIKSIHSNTTAYFVVNGLSSKQIPVTRGIRQGCPIAPLIFILALEMLLLAINKSTLVSGIKFTSSTYSTTISSVAFIDDTTLLLNATRQIPEVMRILKKFAIVSGLKINNSKTKLLILNKAHHLSKLHSFNVVQQNEYISFLGIYLGHENMAKHNWEMARKKIIKRLQIFSAKTSNLVSRKKLLNSITGAQIAFLAQYYLPTLECLNTIQHDTLAIFWKGHALNSTVQNQVQTTNTPIMIDDTKCSFRNPLAKELTTLPNKLGGLGVQDIRYTIMKTSLRMAIRWALMAPSQEKAAINELILNQTRLTVPILPIQKWGRGNYAFTKAEKGIWAYNLKVLSNTQPDISELKDYRKLLHKHHNMLWNMPLTQMTSTRNITWSIPYFDRGKWKEFAQVRDKLIKKMRPYIVSSPINGNNFLTNRQGRTFSTNTFKDLAFTDVFEVRKCTQWEGEVIIKTFSRKSKDLLTAFLICGIYEELKARDKWPEVYLGEEIRDRQIHYDQVKDCLVLTAKHPGITADYLNFDHPITFKIANRPDATAYAPFHYPFISAMIERSTFYNNTELKQNFRKKRIKQVLQKKALLIFYKSQMLFKEKKHIKWQKSYPHFIKLWKQPRINTTVWRSMHALGVENFWLRFSYNIHNFWWKEYDMQEQCMIPFCHHIHFNSKQHIFFDCVRAQFIYRRLLKWWLGHTNFVLKDWFDAFFTNIPLQLPINSILSGTSKTFWKKNFHMIISTVKVIWKIATQIIPMCLWSHRNDLVFNNIQRNNVQVWNEIWQMITNNLHSILEYYKKKRHGARIKLMEIFLKNQINGNERILTTTETSQHLGWFDGGFRRKTDDGAAGSVLAWLKAGKMEIVDLKSEYIGKDQTNNLAEYKALYNLTKIAKHHNCKKISIRGDSNMIIEQMNNRHQCKKSDLRILLAKSLLNLSNIDYTSCHVRREWNQATDMLANLANDTLINKTLTDLIKHPTEYNRFIQCCNIDITHEGIPIFIRPLPEIDKGQ